MFIYTVTHRVVIWMETTIVFSHNNSSYNFDLRSLRPTTWTPGFSSRQQLLYEFKLKVSRDLVSVVTRSCWLLTLEGSLQKNIPEISGWSWTLQGRLGGTVTAYHCCKSLESQGAELEAWSRPNSRLPSFVHWQNIYVILRLQSFNCSRPSVVVWCVFICSLQQNSLYLLFWTSIRIQKPAWVWQSLKPWHTFTNSPWACLTQQKTFAQRLSPRIQRSRQTQLVGYRSSPLSSLLDNATHFACSFSPLHTPYSLKTRDVVQIVIICDLQSMTIRWLFVLHDFADNIMPLQDRSLKKSSGLKFKRYHS